mmetsp:Transcript_1266/g.3821  ORF Transcript_1266/g.3821 Transcript_1266/m.3821 type:complete len:246 (-) Transcript_1266:86-823(-)|eukprot:CAMPEP_0119271784 /NCGR_PEP_ID=MMETSP1329-20130426/8236_1 /TAXON_ID=114041 /ORGANISM="Genus nov. species nov., Strain RCC1024" /LENGTH=245 /DNA_ID=CAMNT_0007271837 /DNA_START=113 /DNA_END=850 /DNA_ORIENTATION=+
MLAARAFRTVGRVAAQRAAQAPVAGARAWEAPGAARALLAPPARSFASPSAKSDEDNERMPQSHADYSNTALLMLSANGDPDAIRERMVRDIMFVDGVTWEAAQPTVAEIEKSARSGLFLVRFPYRVGILAALVAGFGSIPMCFDLHTTLWFNEGYVTTDVPEPKDLETWLEVGSWSWNWMEPPLGQASFFLLCLQYARDQMKNIGMTTYTEASKARRGRSLVSQYPQYNPLVVADFSKSIMENH